MSLSRAARGAAFFLIVLMTCVARVSAHDIPRDVTVQAFAKPEGHSFKLLVRVPLKAIMDIEFPRKERDYVDLARRVVTALRFMPPSGVVRPYELEGDAGLVPLDPRWLQAALRFVHLGFSHILDGTDHLLFLFCLVIPFRRMWTLVPIVTAFTVAHSITLISAAYNYAPGALWFPPLIEVLIAMSIVYMALENIVAITPHRRWLITFLFGLVHGFGFSFGLQHTVQFAGSHLLTSLLSFNLGVELGQLLVLVLMVPALDVLFRFVVAERMGTIILSALVAHTAWHWMIDRFGVLRQFPWPTVTAADAASAIRWAMLLIALAATAWLVSRATASARAAGTPRTPGRVVK